jgi:hypothetical protein
VLGAGESRRDAEINSRIRFLGKSHSIGVNERYGISHQQSALEFSTWLKNMRRDSMEAEEHVLASQLTFTSHVIRPPIW